MHIKQTHIPINFTKNKSILLDPQPIQNPFSKTHETQKQLLLGLVTSTMQTQIGGDERELVISPEMRELKVCGGDERARIFRLKLKSSSQRWESSWSVSTKRELEPEMRELDRGLVMEREIEIERDPDRERWRELEIERDGEELRQRQNGNLRLRLLGLAFLVNTELL